MSRTPENIELTTTVIGPPPVEATSQRDDTSPSSSPWSTENENDITGQALAPADGGLAAWRLLLAAFVFEALLWGKSLSDLATNVIELTMFDHRLSFVFWSIPELLLAASRICWQSLHLGCWYHCVWTRLSWSTCDHALCAVSPSPTTPDDFGRL
jgi:hypothetical protein